MKLPLQQLVVTHGWRVEYHQFYAVDPHLVKSEEDIRWYLKEDLYQSVHTRCNRLIDLGWYPEFDVESGEFGLVLYAGDCQGEMMREFRSSSRQKVVDTMNIWFAEVSLGNL